MPEALQIALVTDIHNGKESLTKKGGMALPLLQRFGAFVDEAGPDLVLDLGDRITDVDRDTDRAALAEVAGVFERMRAPRVHLLGNHDRAFMSIEDNAELLGQSLCSSSLDLKGWHLVFWQADPSMSRTREPRLSDRDLEWLRADLAANSLPAIVFTHIPLDAASMTGNYYFQSNPQFATYANAEAARRVIAEAGNVALCVAGHVHWNNISRIDGVPYLSLQSLTESFTTQGEASGSWALIEADRALRWRGYGDDPIELRVELGGGNKRWTPPLPPFHELARKRRSRPRDLHHTRALLTDLDGVVYRGDTPIPGSIELLADVLASGRAVVAITNNARASAIDYQRKLQDMGLSLPLEHIVTSGQALAAQLTADRDCSGLYIAASPALREVLLDAGLIESDRPSHVVAGIDEDMPISRLSRALQHLNDGARLVASNADPAVPTATGLAPEAGAVVAFLERASGQTAQVAGKPNPAIFELALARLRLDARDVLMIGDTLDTDILGANRAGIRSVLVRSGNPPDADSHAIPDFSLDDLGGLREHLGL